MGIYLMSKKEKKRPRLRTVDKVKTPYPLNEFPENFGYRLGRELIYLIATKSHPTVKGGEWEEIFAKCIGADWKPSNVGLDDVVLGNFAWGAKTVKAASPSKQKVVRLISGRNSPVYSFGETQVSKVDPNHIGPLILEIWNERVSSIREKFMQLRTVVLIKSNDLLETAVFEFETVRYDPELYYWEWNKKGNLEGRERSSKQHKFTWQPHGSQFTIKEKVPQEALIVKIKSPPKIEKQEYLEKIGFKKDWVEVIKRHG